MATRLTCRFEAEELLRGTDAYPQAIHGSPATVYRLALERGLIDQERVDRARAMYTASEWNYAGD